MNLSTEKRKKLSELDRAIERDKLDLEEAEKLIYPNRREVEQQEKKVRDLEKKRDDNQKEEEELWQRLSVFWNASYTDTSTDEVFETNFGDEVVITAGNGGSLNGVLGRFCIHFSNWDNPFLSSYTAAQRKELVESITGQPEILNNGGTANPTPYSFDWFQKTWDYFKNYADEYFYYNKLENIKDIKGFEEPRLTLVGGNKVTYKFRDTAKLIKDMKESSDWSKKNWAISNLYSSSKMPLLYHLKVFTNIPSVVSGIDKQKAQFAHTDFMHFFAKCFPNNTRDTNLLLNKISTASHDYTMENVGPDWMKNVTYENIGVHSYLVAKSTTGNSKKNVDFQKYSYKPVDELMLVNIDENKAIKVDQPKLVKKANNFKELVERFHQVFSPSVQRKFIRFRYLRTVSQGFPIIFEDGFQYINPSTDSDYLTNRKLLNSLRDDVTTFKSLETIEQEISEAKVELIRLKVKHKGSKEDYNAAFAKIRALSEHLNKMIKERNEILIEDEEALAPDIIWLAKELVKDGKKNLDDWNQYADLYPKLQDLVKKRLVGEGKISEDQAKTWTIENSAITNQNQDNTLKEKTVLVNANNKRLEMEKKISPHISTLYSRCINKLKGDFSKLEEWAKNKDNEEDIKKVLEALEKMEGLVNLNAEQVQILDLVRKSEFAPKSLEELLKYIIETADNKTWKKEILTRWSRARFRGVKYNEGENFHRLVSHPDSLIKNADFEKFLNSESSAQKKLADLIENREDPTEIIGLIIKYRVFQYLGKSSEEREKDFKPEEMFELIQEAERNYGNNIDDLTVGTRTGRELKVSIRRAIGKGRGEALGLDFNKPNELNVITKWKNYEPEEIREIIGVIEEKDRKSHIIGNEPTKIHQEYVDKKIAEFGITEENVSQIKQTDKTKAEQLEKLEEILEKAETKGAATEEHKKLKLALTAHRATWKKEEEKGKEEKGKEEKGKEEKGKEEKGKEEKGKEEKGKEEVKWYARAYYAAIWAPLLILAGIGIWFFAFRKPESAQSEEGEEGEGGTTE